VGSNFKFSVAVSPGFKASGKVTPDIVKPVPARVALLTVTGTLPVDDRITDLVDASFSVTLPKATLVVLILSVFTAAFNCRAVLLETVPALAVTVTVSAVVTEATVAVNPALVAPAATVTVAGTETAALLLAKLTLSPPLGAAEVKVTVQASAPAPVRDALLHESALNDDVVGVAAPVPLRLITALPLVEELVVMAN
jgi:hypothetical protein